ncbi:short-chain dehydrogenase/reductase [Nocardia sp. CA-136227]|uniref:short-chain dehydrogenase/reductase n=1 Tax=Nocardia sp. CA-136227 TaxID=3239979 RepID=UPI003D985A63
MELRGKVALVTGGASGIGWATGRLLYQRGARVVLVDLKESEAQVAAERIGPGVLGIGADVTDLDAMVAAVDLVTERFGGLDICIANAGIPTPVDSVSSIDPAAFDRVINVNVLGVWRTVRAALPVVTRRRGHLVVVSSVYAFAPGMLAAGYAASKGAVEQFGRALRIEMSGAGVGVSTARFGFVRTKSFEDVLADPLAVRFENLIPKFLRTRLTPDDAAAAIVRGIEKGRANVFAPTWWTAISALRGIINPLLDYAFARDGRIHALMRDVDAAAKSRQS